MDAKTEMTFSPATPEECKKYVHDRVLGSHIMRYKIRIYVIFVYATSPPILDKGMSHYAEIIITIA